MQTRLEKSKEGWGLYRKESGRPEVLALEVNGILKYSEDPVRPEKELLDYLSGQLKDISVLVIPPCSSVTINCVFEKCRHLEELIIADWNIERLSLCRQQTAGLESDKLTLLELPEDSYKAAAIFTELMKNHHQSLSLGKGAVYVPRRFRRLDRELSDFLEETVLRLQQEACSSAAFRTTRSWHLTINRLLNMRAEKNHFLKIPEKRTPVVVVGAGPSLDYTIQTLAEYSDRALIIATDGSVRSLLKHGIIPDLIAYLDDSDVCWRFLAENLDVLKDTPVVMTMEGSNVLAVNYRGEKIFFRDERTPSWLKPFCSALPCVETGQCVGHFAFHIAEYLEPSEIIMTGFDLGFRDDNFHPEDSAVPYYEELKESFGYIEVDAVDGGKILTDLSMSFYLKYFEEKIPLCRCPVIDATEGGALIRGTEIRTLKEALKKHDLKESLSFGELRQGSSEFDNFMEKLASQIADLKNRLEKAESSSAEMTPNTVRNPISEMPLENAAFAIVTECCNSLLLTEFSKMAEAYSRDLFSSYRQLLLDTLSELKYSSAFLLSFLSAAAFNASGKDAVLVLSVDGKHPDLSAVSGGPLISIPHDLPLPELWDYIISRDVGKIVCVNGNIIPDVWLVPGLECLDVKTCFDPQPYEKSLWLPGYRVAASGEVYDKWREYLPADIACELFEEPEICLS